jgi:hypothetical protein
LQTSSAMRREIEKSYSVVIVREGGRSSIPETSVIEPRSRGVLDHPPSRVTTVLCVVTSSTSLRGALRRSNPCLHKRLDGLLPPSLCELRRTSRCARNDELGVHVRDPLARNDDERDEVTSPTPRPRPRQRAGAWPIALPRTGCCLPRSRRSRIAATGRAARAARISRPPPAGA